MYFKSTDGDNGFPEIDENLQVLRESTIINLDLLPLHDHI